MVRERKNSSRHRDNIDYFPMTSSSQKIVDSNDELMISQDFGYQSSNNIVSSLDTVTHSSAALVKHEVQPGGSSKEKSIASRRSRATHVSQPDFKKDARSIALSVFNMMNLVIGGGVIGLPFAAAQFGYVGFTMAIFTVVIIACCTQYFNLSAAQHLERIDPLIIPGYEELGYLAAGNKILGKRIVSAIVMFHTFTCCCAYSFVIRKECGPILARLINLVSGSETVNLATLRSDGGVEGRWYLNEKTLVGLFIAFIITPLACLRNVKNLGYTSAIAIFAIIFFVVTVITQKDFAAGQCPLEYPESCEHCPETTQECEAHPFRLSSDAIYSLPTLLFSFECHGTMLPIYCDLRRKSKGKMMKIILASLLLVVSVYTITAVFGYFSFFNHVNAEFLLMFEYLKMDSASTEIQVVIAKFMMVLVVTFSAPLFCFVLRKSIFLNIFPEEEPEFIAGKYHYGVTVTIMAIIYCIVVSVEDLKIFFAMGGQISATNLMIVFPSLFFIFICHKDKKLSLKTMLPWILIMFGIFNQTVMTYIIVSKELENSAHHGNTTAH
ncbi:Oidioi.mRNA.OKI2018_I69.XSR.g14589.t1.cds [Oikopleura dioica]|uniref:Oidioi.mRNA.OKI2018_I69.XSR.g14589.t1.cds n=1 Tax=Oikopleura dioica TaxID=34765 RepID=A0ABN7SA87_OIKDI|nr:Oidioi.mRNA.OKI2018_I69.XSR.g14589.t1.cds [Oikopleura dioica]